MSKTPRNTISARRRLPKDGEVIHLALRVRKVRGDEDDPRARLTIEIPGFIGDVVTADAETLLAKALVEE